MTSQGLQGIQTVSFESRQAQIMAEAIERQGGNVLSAPSVQEIPLTENPEAFSFADRLLAGQINCVVFMTGVGTRYLFEVLKTKYDLETILEALRQVMVVARGPKPSAVLKEHKIPITLIAPEPNTWREILECLDENEKSLSIKGQTIAVQEYGTSNAEFLAALKDRGAHVIQVPVYRWALPDNRQPLVNAIDAIIGGKINLSYFTSAVQIRHLFQVAAEQGREKELREAFQKVVIASIGPTTSETLQQFKLPVDFEPSHPKMGHLISETAKQANELLAAKKTPTTFSFSQTVDDPSKRQEAPFLKACRGEKVPYTPVWFMRQAGRYMKEYRDIRAKVPFLELCKRPELCAEVAITAQEKIGADAAILFSDILVIVEPFGLNLSFGAAEGPEIKGRSINAKMIDELPEIDPRHSLSFVMEAIKTTRQHLKSEIPLIGFSGAPFTLASYIIEGGSSKNFLQTKQLMMSDPSAWHALLEKISRGVSKYLQAQIDSGVDCVQIFDSWVGCLSPSDYKTFVLPHTQSIIQSIKGKVPIIHFGTNTSSFLPLMKEAGGDVLGVDFRINLDEAWQIIGHDHAIQGNLDPVALFSPRESLLQKATAILDQAAGKPGHIFNLGHGILPKTPVDNVIAVIEHIHEYSAKS